ncbi:nitroreductase [Niallia circulans]|uniref:Putative NAD(P)H nitroreductase n=1 Tax=Niallia circulans TaxID=1397 RepID=A0A941GCM5_NIACI|nr:nitroreductase [Niallia circulans]MCB5236404.1 nitroreductase [Niallia circulans]
MKYNTEMVDHLIMNRRTIKKFKAIEVNINEIIDLLEIAKWSPNFRLTEPWRFLIFTGEGKEKFVDAYKSSQILENGDIPQKVQKRAEHFSSIPMHIVVLMAEDERQKEWEEDYGAVCSLIQNFQILAWSRGIGMVWRTNEWIDNPIFKNKLSIKSNEKIVATLMVGYPETIPKPKPRTSIKEKIKIIR